MTIAETSTEPQQIYKDMMHRDAVNTSGQELGAAAITQLRFDAIGIVDTVRS
jgi:hypothetical protein